MSACKSCGADILWALTENDKPMPVDVDPVEDGNLELWRDDEGERRVRVLKGAELPFPGLDTPLRYQSHFASCPTAAKHRKGST